jgi:hypothetical protein
VLHPFLPWQTGERGVTLSGGELSCFGRFQTCFCVLTPLYWLCGAGQQQRVSLARAVYSCPHVCLLDDPLSALDAGTSKVIFENLKEVLRDSAIVLVTHAAHFLSQVDKIVLVSNNRAQFTGTWDELMHFEPMDSKTRDAVEHIRSSIQEDKTSMKPENPNMSLSNSQRRNGNAGNGRASTRASGQKIMTVEQREHGLSSLSTWLLWFKHAGGIPFLAMHVLLMTIDRTTYFAVEYWLARWTEGANESVNVFGVEFAPQTDGISAQANVSALSWICVSMERDRSDLCFGIINWSST